MKDSTAIIVASIASIPPTIVALLAWKTSRKNLNATNEVHILINSRMNQLLASSNAAAKAEGKEEGRAETPK